MNLKEATGALRCLDHDSKVVAICFSAGCQRRMLCKTCNKNHTADHMALVEKVELFNEANFLIELEKLSIKLEKEIKEMSTSAQDIIERVDISFKELEDMIVSDIRDAKDSIAMKITSLIRPKTEIYGDLTGLKIQMQRLIPKLAKSKMEDKLLIEEYSNLRSEINEKVFRSTDLTSQVTEVMAKTKVDIAYCDKFREEVSVSFERFKRDTGLSKWQGLSPFSPSKLDTSFKRGSVRSMTAKSDSTRKNSTMSPGSDGGSVTPFDQISMADTLDFGDLGYIDMEKVTQKGRILTKHPGAKGENLEEIEGKYLISTGDDGIICAWVFEKDNVKLVSKLQAHTGRVHCLKWSQVGQILLTGGSDYKVNSYTFDKKKAQFQLGKVNKSHKSQIMTLDYIDDMKLYVSGGLDSILYLVDPITMEHLDSLKMKKPVLSLKFIGEQRICVSVEKEILVIPIHTNKKLAGATHVINAHNSDIHFLKWIDSEGCLYSGSDDGWIKRWQITHAGATLKNIIAQNIGRVDSLIPLPAIGKVAAILNGCLFAFLNIENGEISKAYPFKADGKKGYSMLLMEKRREIFISCPNTIDIWSLGDANI